MTEKNRCSESESNSNTGQLVDSFPFSVWVDASEIKDKVSEIKIQKEFGVDSLRKLCTTIVDSDVFFGTNFLIPIDNIFPTKAAIDHWGYGKSWENTGIIDFAMDRIKKNGSFDWMTTYDQVVERYEALDNVFKRVKENRQISSNADIAPEKNHEDAMVHVGPTGSLYFAGGAHHRLAMAKVLNIPLPAQCCLVHYNGLQTLEKFPKTAIAIRSTNKPT